MVLKSGLKRPNSWKNGTRLAHVYTLFVWLVEWPVSCRYWPCTIVRVFFFDALSHKTGHIFGLRGSLWRVFGSNTEKTCTERSFFMYEKALGCFWWSLVPIVALHFGRTCVLQLPSVWSKEASVLAYQGVQEGSGACNFFSNGYCGQVLCTWTGAVALGAGLCRDEVAYRHLSFASCWCFSVVFSIHTPNTRNAFVLWRQLLLRFSQPSCVLMFPLLCWHRTV